MCHSLIVPKNPLIMTVEARPVILCSFHILYIWLIRNGWISHDCWLSLNHHALYFIGYYRALLMLSLVLSLWAEKMSYSRRSRYSRSPSFDSRSVSRSPIRRSTRSRSRYFSYYDFHQIIFYNTPLYILLYCPLLISLGALRLMLRIRVTICM